MTVSQADKAKKFRALHEAPGSFVIPNPWDGGSARVLAGLGFEALATSSGAKAGVLGKRDGKVSREEALANAMTEWPNGGMKFPKADIRSPFDFEQMAKLVRPEDFEGRMLISSDLEAHRREIQKFADMGFDKIYLHNVGRNQKEWIEAFGREVLPKITR